MFWAPHVAENLPDLPFEVSHCSGSSCHNFVLQALPSSEGARSHYIFSSSCFKRACERAFRSGFCEDNARQVTRGAYGPS
jgi:hypothetical protein